MAARTKKQPKPETALTKGETMSVNTQASASKMSETGRTYEPVLKGASSSSDAKIRFVRPSELAKENQLGLVVEGIFQGTTPNNFDATKTDFKILGDDGVMVVVNGGGNLGYQMASATIGQGVRIAYNGKQKITKGKFAGKEAHNFSVDIEK